VGTSGSVVLLNYLRFACAHGNVGRVSMPVGIVDARTARELVRVLRRDHADLDALSAIEAEMLRALRPAVRHLVAVLSRVAEEATPALLDAPDADLDAIREMAVVRGVQSGLSGWAGEYGFAAGSLAATVAALRELTGHDPVVAPGGIGPLAATVSVRLLNDALSDALNERQDPLARIKSGLDLTDTELGSLFGVSRQAAAQWLSDGVPAARMPAVGHIVATVDLLARKLKSGRLPLVARQPADRLGGSTMLEAFTADPQAARTVFEEAFDWAASA
jgi:hypothetical protein